MDHSAIPCSSLRSEEIPLTFPEDALSLSLSRSAWIWASHGDLEVDRYVCFRHRFTLPLAVSGGWLAIAADSDFVAYLNGREIGRGQFSDFAQEKTWSHFETGPLTDGEQVLAILVYHRGVDFFDYQAGHPGVIAALLCDDGTVISTDANWRWKEHAAFQSGRAEKMTPQCGFTFVYDARDECPWSEPQSDDTAWQLAKVVQHGGAGAVWRSLTPRPLPSLILQPLRAVRVTCQGEIYRQSAHSSPALAMGHTALRVTPPWDSFLNGQIHPSGSYSSPAANVGEFLSPEASEPLLVKAPAPGSSGRFFIVDLGRQTVGLLEFEIDAPEGCTLEIGHGEHLDDGRVRASLNGRHFADRYICGKGRRRFQMPFRRLGCRYLEVHLSAEATIYAMGIRATDYPSRHFGGFSTHDFMANRLQEISVRTLELCRHEHYEDSPWREQALYAYDSRFQALYGYYSFGDYRFPEVSFGLLARTLKQEGLLALTAPSRYSRTIPSFSLAWITAVYEHWLYSGSPVLFTTYRTVVDAIIETAFARLDSATGLYAAPEGPGIWNFYEWSAGMADIEKEEVRQSIRFHAAYQLFVMEAASSYLQMLALSGEGASLLSTRLESLKNAFHRNFWCEQDGLYSTQLLHDGSRWGRHEKIQVMALAGGAVPEAAQSTLITRLIAGALEPCMLSALYYRLRAALAHSAASREWLVRTLAEPWTTMILKGATTMWETRYGGDDFHQAGSLCHGWSALPVYYHQGVVLGIQPLLPGFAAFRVKVLPSGLFTASGTIPTPHGKIAISWKKRDNGLVLAINGPETCTPVLDEYPEAPILSARYNGRELTLQTTDEAAEPLNAFP